MVTQRTIKARKDREDLFAKELGQLQQEAKTTIEQMFHALYNGGNFKIKDAKLLADKINKASKLYKKLHKITHTTNAYIQEIISMETDEDMQKKISTSIATYKPNQQRNISQKSFQEIQDMLYHDICFMDHKEYKSVRRRHLQKRGITNLMKMFEQFGSTIEDELLKIPHMGRVGVEEMRDILQAHGLDFTSDVQSYKKVSDSIL